jgi:hypothetical protein
MSDLEEAIERLQSTAIYDHEELHHGPWDDCPRVMCRRNRHAWAVIRASLFDEERLAHLLQDFGYDIPYDRAEKIAAAYRDMARDAAERMGRAVAR